MSIFASPADAAELRAIYADAIEDALYADPPGAVDEVELGALTAMPPLLHPAIPVECARLFAGILEECGDEAAAGALDVFERLAAGPLGEAASAASQRLAAAGVVSPLTDEIGTLSVQRCRRADLPSGVSFYLLTLARPCRPGHAQAALVSIGPGACRHPVAGGFSVGAAHPLAVVTEALDDFPSGGWPSRGVDGDELASELAGALGHMVEHGCGALFEEDFARLGIVERALVGEPGVLPRPLLALPEYGSGERRPELGPCRRPRRPPPRRRGGRPGGRRR